MPATRGNGEVAAGTRKDSLKKGEVEEIGCRVWLRMGPSGLPLTAAGWRGAISMGTCGQLYSGTKRQEGL